MGDKSPKSKQKDKSQKQSKTDSVNVAKQKMVESKRAVIPAAPKKKK